MSVENPTSRWSVKMLTVLRGSDLGVSDSEDRKLETHFFDSLKNAGLWLW